jgi:hypothetical protein
VLSSKGDHVTTIKRQKGGRKLKTTTKIIFQRFVDEKKRFVDEVEPKPKAKAISIYQRYVS